MGHFLKKQGVRPDWIQVAQNRVQWWALVNMKFEPLDSIKVGGISLSS
jgi:hypothetical protein